MDFKIISNVEFIPSMGDVRQVLITEKNGSTSTEYKSLEWIELQMMLNQVEGVLGHTLGEGFKNIMMEKLNNAINDYVSSEKYTGQTY
jgi:hypothetical protein